MNLAGNPAMPLRGWLRAEAAVTFLVATIVYRELGGSWGLFALLFLMPDLSFAGYLGGPRTGALVYNLFHTSAGPLLLAAVGLLLPETVIVRIALIWLAHVGFDRLLGYGLKRPQGFHQTHLGPIGKARHATVP